MQRRCPVCREGFLSPGVVEHHWTVGGRTYRANLDAMRCDNNKCGDSLISDEVLERFELAVSSELAKGEPGGEAFVFMRKAIGLSRVAVAKVLRVAPDVVVDWEKDAQPVEWRAWVLLCLMVEEQGRGSTATRDKLEAQGSATSSGQDVTLGHLAAQPAL